MLQVANTGIDANAEKAGFVRTDDSDLLSALSGLVDVFKVLYVLQLNFLLCPLPHQQPTAIRCCYSTIATTYSILICSYKNIFVCLFST